MDRFSNIIIMKYQIWVGFCQVADSVYSFCGWIKTLRSLPEGEALRIRSVSIRQFASLIASCFYSNEYSGNSFQNGRERLTYYVTWEQALYLSVQELLSYSNYKFTILFN